MPIDASSTELLNKKKRSNKKRRNQRKFPSKTRLLDGNETNGVKNVLNCL